MNRIAYIYFIIFGILLFPSLSFPQTHVDSMESLSIKDSISLDLDQSISEFILTQALVIHSGESETMRWISIAQSTPGQYFLQPTVESDANDGSFIIQLSGLDTIAYLGSRMFRQNGHFPIHYRVDFPDSESVQISGKTLSYDDVQFYYSFDQDEYRFEFIFKDQINKAFNQVRLNSPGVDARVTAVKEQGGQLEKGFFGSKYSEIKLMLWDSIYIAGAALSVTFLLLIFVVIVKKQIRKLRDKPQNFAEMLDKKVVSPDEIEGVPNKDLPEMTPEQQEEKIRNMMETEKLSYDEAALRIQYKMVKQSDG